MAVRYVDVLRSQINCDDDYEKNLEQIMKNTNYPNQDISVRKIRGK